MGIQYPDVISEYLDADERYENNGIQIVPSIEPPAISRGGHGFLIFLLQNSLDVPAEIILKPEIPTSRRIGGGPVLELSDSVLHTSLDPAQVGSFFVPVGTTEHAREGKFEITLNVSVTAQRGGNRVRPARSDGPFPDKLIDDVVGLGLGRAVGVTYKTVQPKKLSIPFSITSEVEAQPELPAPSAKFDSLWKAEDFASQSQAVRSVDEQRSEILAALPTEKLYATLFSESQQRFAQMGVPLFVGEAIAMGKILTFTARYFLDNQTLQDGLLVPIWEIGHQIDLPTTDPLWLLRDAGFGHLLRLSAAASFGLIGQAFQSQPWDIEERRSLIQFITEKAEAEESIPPEFLYIPLLIGAALISRQLVLENEDPIQSLNLLQKAKAARSSVFEDPDLAQASQMFDRIMDASLKA